MMHYSGRYETTDLFLTNEQAEERLDQSIQTLEQVKEGLQGKIWELEKAALEIGAKPRYVEKAKEQAEDTRDKMKTEIETIKEARENPPEQTADQQYIQNKEIEATSLAENIDFTPRREQT